MNSQRQGGSAGAAEHLDLTSTDPLEPHPFEAAERYDPRATLGEGGMGRVTLVYDRRLARDVALKTPRDPGDAARLAQEAWITAQLEHPGIVPIYDAGRTADGALYYTMRVIRGRSLEDELAAAPDAATRLRYVRHYLAACEAVAYAHKLGVVHRDLKPQNILVGELGETQVADWGVARPAGGALGDAWSGLIPEGHAVMTMVGGVVGTPAYMSPEQSLGAVADVRADVWSLGAILYRLLANRPPFAGETASEVIAAVRARPVPVPEGPRELVAITTRALSRDPAARYASARELARDVASWLDGRRVSAYSYSSIELLKRLVRAWRVPLAIAAIALVVLIIGGVIAFDRVVVARERADRTLGQSLLAQAQRELMRGQLPEAEVLAAESLRLNPTPEARGILLASDVARPHIRSAHVLPACEVRALSPDATHVACGRESLEVWSLAPPTLRWTAPIAARFVTFTDDALVVADRLHRIQRFALATGQPLHDPTPVHQASGLAATDHWSLAHWGWAVARIDEAGRAAVDPVCRRFRTVRLALARPGPYYVIGCDDGHLHWRDGDTWQAVPEPLEPDAIGTRGALSPSRSRLATINERGRLTILAWPSGTRLVDRVTTLRGPQALTFSPDDRWLAVASRHGATEVLDAATGETAWRLPRDVAEVVWAEALVTRAADHLATWDLPTRSVAARIGGDAGIAALAIHDGRVAVGRGTGVVDIHMIDGTKIRSLALGDQTVKSLAFAPGRLYVGVVGSPSIRVFATDEWRELGGLGALSYRRVGVLASGLVIGASWSLAPERFPGPAVKSEASAFDLDVAFDGSFAALLEDETGGVLLTEGGDPRRVAVITGAATVAAHPDGLAVATATRVHLFDREGRALGDFALVAAPLDLAFTRDARHLVVGEADGARVYDRSGQVLAVLRGHEERVAQVVTTPDAIYTASWDGAVRRWGLGALGLSADQALHAAVTRWGMDLGRALGAAE